MNLFEPCHGDKYALSCLAGLFCYAEKPSPHGVYILFFSFRDNGDEQKLEKL